MKEIFKKMWKIVKIVAVFVWRNRRGGCPRGVGGKQAKNGSLMDGGEEWRERDGEEGWRRGMYGREEEQGKGRIFFYIAEEKILKEVIKKMRPVKTDLGVVHDLYDPVPDT